MAGAGRAPKDSDRRISRGGRESVTVPESGNAVDVPAWPLAGDVALDALIQMLDDSIEEMTVEYETESDSRKRGGIARKLENAKRSVATSRARREIGSVLECEIWNDLWSLPQAAEWRRLGWTRDLAQYARHKARGEMGSLDDAKEARQWSDRLGLSPRAASVLGWKFAPAQPTAPRATGGAAEKVTDISSRRSRLSE